MTDRTWASELRGELERAVANHRSRTKWYVAAAAAAIAVTVAVVAVVDWSGNPPRSDRTEASAANAAPDAISSLNGAPGAASSSASGAVGELGNVPVGDPADSLAGAESRAKFDVEVPDTADANAQNVTAIYADTRAVEMHFPPPDDQSRQLDPPYINVVEHDGDGNDPPITVQRELAVLQQAFKEAGDEVGLSLVSACNVGTLPALCIAPDPGPQEAVCSGTNPVVCAGPHRNTAFVRFVDGNVEVQIDGGTSVDRLIQIGESMSSRGSASSGAG
jgi:hypothetical protein